MSHHPARHPDDARAAPAATASKYAAPTGSAAAAVDMPFRPSASLVSAADADTAYGAHRLQVSARVARRLADPARLHVVHGPRARAPRAVDECGGGGAVRPH